MTTHSNPRLIASFVSVSRATGAIAGLIGGLELAGWTLDFLPLGRVALGLTTMPASTALAVLLAGTSLWFLCSSPLTSSIRNPKSKIQNPSRRLAQLSAGLISLIGLVTLCDALFGWTLGTITLGALVTAPPGRPSPGTALNTVLIGFSLVLLDVEIRRGYRPAQLLAFTAGVLSLLALVGHVYGFYGLPSSTGMTLPTAFTDLLLGVSILCARPDRGLMAIVASEGAGGVMARRLLLAVIGIPSVLGWLRLEGERVGFYDTQLGVSLLVISIIVCFLILIWWYAKFLNRTDAARLHAEAARKATERELEAQRLLTIRADRLRSLGEMAAGIAHELNQPLVGVRGLAEHLLIGMDRGWALPQDKLRDKLTLIVEQADRMTHIIQHVRLFAREAGRFERQPVQINDVVRSAIEMLDAQFRSRGLGLTCELAAGLPVVSANPFSLEEVVLNLLVNARDATEERLLTDATSTPLCVLVRTRSDGNSTGDSVQIEVIDQGVGIPPSILPRVFDPFFTTKGPDRGTGLGLAVSRSIVEQFGGTIHIQSTPGHGTTVTISLPAEPPYVREEA